MTQEKGATVGMYICVLGMDISHLNKETVVHANSLQILKADPVQCFSKLSVYHIPCGYLLIYL